MVNEAKSYDNDNDAEQINYHESFHDDNSSLQKKNEVDLNLHESKVSLHNVMINKLVSKINNKYVVSSILTRTFIPVA